MRRGVMWKSTSAPFDFLVNKKLINAWPMHQYTSSHASCQPMKLANIAKNKIMMLSRWATLVATLAVLNACQLGDEIDTPVQHAASVSYPVITERYLTPRNEDDNVDSIASWHTPPDRHWLLATAKSSHQIIVYDARDGSILQKFGGPGSDAGRFRHPNGISVIDNLALIVERDNRRVQVLTLPDFTPLGSFGEQYLRRPYGLWLHRKENGRYRVFVTDAYDIEDGDTRKLDRRIQVFEFMLFGDTIDAKWQRQAGEQSGKGVLRDVESLYGDAEYNLLLIADEAKNQRNIKVFDLDLNFRDMTIGDGLFQSEAEGIALYRCMDGSGFWIATDQGKRRNNFLVFDRQTLEFLGGFSGRTTRNTDGIWLTQEAFAGFPQGAFFAVHDDGGVAAFAMEDILQIIKREPCR